MRMNLFFIDEDKCFTIYQCLENSEDSTWSLHSNDTFDLKVFVELH
jgi:hypothetical protein